MASGTGATGWARSIMEATGTQERAIAYFMREPFPSISTGTSLKAGKLSEGSLSVTSRMNNGGTIFADGMEQDYLRFHWGQRLAIAPSNRAVRLVTA